MQVVPGDDKAAFYLRMDEYHHRDESQHRRVIDLFKCVNPNGIPTEVFRGRPMTGFKTGELGMGHILVYAQSLDQAVHFYRDLLGFRVSDFTEVSSAGGKVRLRLGPP